MSKANGFSLLECIVVIAILVILITLTMPTYQYICRKHQIDIAILTLYRAIRLARFTAMHHNEIVTLCPSLDYKNCGGCFEDGYIIFVDQQGDGQVDSHDQIIKAFQKSNALGKFYWRNFPSRNYLQFTPLGFTNNQNGTFFFCPKDKDKSLIRSIIVSKTGVIRMAQGEEDAC